MTTSTINEILYYHAEKRQGIPGELIDIQKWWTEKANDYGDIGSCVLGAHFTFSYKGEQYIMPPVCKWQGAAAWEHCVDEVEEALEELGCTNIQYDWGRID